MKLYFTGISALIGLAFGIVAMQLSAANGESMGVSPNTMVLPLSTVSALPVCNASLRGTVYLVTDALLPSFLSIVVGGGGITVPVTCNGTNFVGF